MKYTGTVGNTPKFDDELKFEKQSKKQYRKQQKQLRNLRKQKHHVWDNEEN